MCGLHLLEQRRAAALAEQVDARQREALLRGQCIVEGVELAHEVAALAAPGGEQRMGVRMHLVEIERGQIAPAAQRLAAPVEAQQLAALDDVGPVEAARIGNRQQHLDLARQRRQRLQRLHRHVRHAEQHDAARQARARPFRPIERGEKALVQLRPDRGARGFVERRQHLAPEAGLPALAVRQRRRSRPPGVAAGRWSAPAGPGAEPVAAVDLVLVVQIGQPLRQLQPAIQAAALQEAGQRLEAGALEQRRQQLHQPPGQRQLVERRLRRHRIAAEHLPVGAPQEARRQLDAGRGADAGVRGQAHLQPLGHAVALDQEDLLLERRQRMRRDPFEDGLAQQLGAVAVQHQQAGADGIFSHQAR